MNKLALVPGGTPAPDAADYRRAAALRLRRLVPALTHDDALGLIDVIVLASVQSLQQYLTGDEEPPRAA